MLSLSTMASDNYKSSHDPSYAHNQWSHMQGYGTGGNQHNTPPIQEYQNYDFSPPPPTSMSMDMPYHMPRSSQYQPQHQHLPPLAILPQVQPIWPSMLTSQQGQPPQQPTYQTPILAAAPVQTPVSAVSTAASDVTPTSATKGSSSRRKLTDDERRKMCIEAENNPNMKQTQIGLKFGVERSTVSKILRQKEKYMNKSPKEGSASPPKKTKIKFPDIERALSNWVKNEQRKGQAITDDKLRQQAVFFSAAFGSSDNHSYLTSDAWLARFKQKNQIGHALRKGKSISSDLRDVTIADSSTTSYDAHLEHSPNSSPGGLVSPPMSEDDLAASKHEQDDNFFDFGNRHAGHDSLGLGQVLSPDLENGGAVLSPLSPELNRSGSTAMTSSGLDLSSPGYAQAFGSRQRSQTFPHFEAEPGTISRPTSSSGRHTPALPVRSMTNSIAPQDLHVNPREMMKRSESVPNIREGLKMDHHIYTSSMRPPPLPRSERGSPSSGSAPSQEEARRALQIIKTFFAAQPTGTLDNHDWTSIGKLMEKLKLPNNTDDSGGMSTGMPLDMLDDPRPMKKRTILGIST